MKIENLKVKLRFVDSKVLDIQRPDIALQNEIIAYINEKMSKYGAHVIDLEVRATKDEA